LPFASFASDVVLRLTAESHVDRCEFTQTNIIGTYVLLQAALDYWRAQPDEKRAAFCFHHISTDDVFGSLGQDVFL
jgi:dTDP-glucose 4,6-dehydratase